jgi:STAS domain
VLLDMSSVNMIDVSACDELITFIKGLQSRGITVAFARVRDTVRQDMQLGGMDAVVDSADFHERITDGGLCLAAPSATFVVKDFCEETRYRSSLLVQWFPRFSVRSNRGISQAVGRAALRKHRWLSPRHRQRCLLHAQPAATPPNRRPA